MTDYIPKSWSDAFRAHITEVLTAQTAAVAHAAGEDIENARVICNAGAATLQAGLSEIEPRADWSPEMQQCFRETMAGAARRMLPDRALQ